MTTLVTGDSSALGRRLTGRLAATSRPVVGISRTSRDRPLHIGDRAELRSAFEDVSPEVVVHLAGVSGSAATDAELARAINVDGTAAVIDAALHTSVRRIVFASTAAVYGTSGSAPAQESDALQLGSHYAESKREAEILLANAAGTLDLEIVTLRIFNIWGQGYPDSLIERLHEATPESPVVLLGLDRFVRDYVHVDDVVDAIISAEVSPQLFGNTVLNIGSGIPMSNRELVAATKTAANSIYVSGDVSSYSCADISRARELLDYLPTRSPGRNDRLGRT